MSDHLAAFQNWIAQYPSWMVAGGIGCAVVVAAVLIWKALRMAVVVLIVAVVVAGAWYVWEGISQRAGGGSEPAATEASAPGR